MPSRFTVDTHLFRELGELLVGRDSTALIELIKNAYDADATRVTIHGERLDQPSEGRIVVDDNGNGISREEFEQGFLRVATRMKDTGARKSALLGRRLTGQKGIGRLAAHKLATKLKVTSNAARRDEQPVPWSSKDAETLRTRLVGSIDWTELERYATLEEAEGIDYDVTESAATAAPGTRIELSPLRRRWTDTERRRFAAEVNQFGPAPIFTDPLPTDVLPAPALFASPVVRDAGEPTFDVTLTGELDVGEEYWSAIAGEAAWVVELVYAPGSATADVAVAPTATALAELGPLHVARFTPPAPEGCPGLNARILIRTGVARGPLKEAVRRSSGVRVYLEGFRVPPYGEPGDDWLGLDLQRASRGRSLSGEDTDDPADSEAALSRPGNRQLFGAVFLTERAAPQLRMLVNREGFVPEAGYLAMTKLLSAAIDLYVRESARAREAPRSKRRQERQQQARARDDVGLSATFTRTLTLATGLERDARRLGVPELADQAAVLREELTQTQEAADDLLTLPAITRVMATLGTQLAAFVHEINTVLTLSRSLRERLQPFSGREPDLTRAAALADELARHLERQAAYLVDIAAPDARRRRSRQPVGQVFDAAASLLRNVAERQGISIANEIAPEMRSPPMFRAELIAVFSNLLTNAIKAAGHGGEIRAYGKARRVTVENTGVAVDPTEGERWFGLYASSTETVDPVLGQGIGLGLAITRAVLAEYGAQIRFASPSNRMATAVEIEFPST